MKNQYIRGNCLKRRGFGQFSDLRRGLGKKKWGGGCVFEWGVDIPMNTMNLTIILTMILIY